MQTVTENASPRSLSGAGDVSENINYTYDQNGNITRENNAILQWTATGRIKQYGDRQRYAYDAAQRRVKKTDGTTTQYYVYDATGNILALYTFRDDSLFWSGSPIYGTNRLGMYHANKQLPSARPGNMDTLWRGNTEYELTNHLGDVLATITDKKLIRTEGSSTYSSDLLTAQEYLPFGMHMPNRTYTPPVRGAISASSNATYPFAYNGMERDRKDSADGYTTEFRQYDSRIGRWKSMDPKTEKTYSCYDGFGNNPIVSIDIKGDDNIDINDRAGSGDATAESTSVNEIRPQSQNGDNGTPAASAASTPPIQTGGQLDNNPAYNATRADREATREVLSQNLVELHRSRLRITNELIDLNAQLLRLDITPERAIEIQNGIEDLNTIDRRQARREVMIRQALYPVSTRHRVSEPASHHPNIYQSVASPVLSTPGAGNLILISEPNWHEIGRKEDIKIVTTYGAGAIVLFVLLLLGG